MRSKVIGLSLAALLVAGAAYGAALTANRDTKAQVGDEVVLGVVTGAHIYAGALVAVSNGYACPAADFSGLSVIGRAEQEVNNANHASGYQTVRVRRGVFGWANTGEITNDSYIGNIAFVTDDQTVTTSNTSYYVIAGPIIQYSDGTVWVDTKDLGAQGASTPSTLTVAGAGLIGTTLGVGGAATLASSLAVAGTTAITNVTTLSLNGRKVISSKDNTTSYVIESGSATGKQVITYTTPFSAAPQVLLSASSIPTINTPTNLVAIPFGSDAAVTSRFTTAGVVGTDSFNWLAIGAK